MRKITTEAIHAFKYAYSFKKDNTEVELLNQPHMDSIHLYLHGNEIATKIGLKLTISSCGWETTTTKERLNGVLDAFNIGNIQQYKGTWYIITDLCFINGKKSLNEKLENKTAIIFTDGITFNI